MFVTNWISPTKIQKISEITNFFRHYFLSRTEVVYRLFRPRPMEGWQVVTMLVYSSLAKAFYKIIVQK